MMKPFFAKEGEGGRSVGRKHVENESGESAGKDEADGGGDWDTKTRGREGRFWRGQGLTGEKVIPCFVGLRARCIGEGPVVPHIEDAGTHLGKDACFRIS